MRTAGPSTERAAALAIGLPLLALALVVRPPASRAQDFSAIAEATPAAVAPAAHVVSAPAAMPPASVPPASVPPAAVPTAAGAVAASMAAASASSQTETSETNPSTVEIPPAQASIAPEPPVDVTTDPADGAALNGAPDPGAVGNKDAEEYENAQNPPPAPHLHSLREFMSEGTDTSPIGLELREDRRKLSGGGQADGLLIVKVHSGSPAADAGLHAYSTAGHAVLEGAAVAAAMLFPPAVLAIAVLDQTHIGESYDLIIGVDGKRVTNYLDFEDELRDIKPGDVVYLSVVRNGKRVQIAVHVPATATAAGY
jgi:hypothetical protein